MFQDMFARSRHVVVFGEANKRAMTEQWRMRDKKVIGDLVRRSDKKVTLFKPLNDSQWADELLEHFSAARVIWIFRNPFDTVNSAVEKWGSSQEDMMTWIGKVIREAGSLEKATLALDLRPSYSTYAERLSAEDGDRLVKWTEQPLDDYAGAAVLWYLRNRIFFNQRLQNHERVMLISYEELVQHPEREVRRICEFIRLRYSSRYARQLHTKSIRKSPWPVLPLEIENAAVDLYERLNFYFERQRRATPVHSAVPAHKSC